jgi:predicted TIM-barrel fold metal-dependent hydrolase
MTTNDAHCHFFSDRFLAALATEWARGAGAPDGGAGALAERLGWEPPGDAAALADRWVAELDRHGVARCVLIASVPGDEESVGAAVRRHPSRFVGYFMLDASREDAADRARRALGELGLRVACLFPAMHRYRLDEDRVLRVVEAIAAHAGAGVFVHCGILTVGVRRLLGLPSRFDMRLGDPLAVHLLAAAFPAVRFIVPHFGGGFFREALMLADLAPNVVFDTSSSNAWIRYHPGLTLDKVFHEMLAVAGASRLMFGTDSSFFPRGWQAGLRDAQIGALRNIGADRAVVSTIMAGTFDAVFPPDGRR